VIHIVGRPLEIMGVMRQRCVWCGELLTDYDLRNIASSDGSKPGFWEEGALLEVTGENPRVSSIVPHEDWANLPPNACAIRREPLRLVDPNPTGGTDG